MRILLAEDDPSKRDRIASFLQRDFAECLVHMSKSVRSTEDCLLDESFDILLLDMSLPTFDIAAGEPGGRPQGFGGLEVMRFIDAQEIAIPIIVVTQHDEFTTENETLSLAELSERAREEAPNTFRGLVYYNTISGEWQDALSSKIKSIISEEGVKL